MFLNTRYVLTAILVLYPMSTLFCAGILQKVCFTYRRVSRVWRVWRGLYHTYCTLS